MSDEKKYTERDVIGRERDAYARGHRDGANNWTAGAYARSEVASVRLYPLPKVDRPRVETVLFRGGDACRIRIVDGVVEYTFGMHPDASWWGVEQQIRSGNEMIARHFEPIADAIRRLRERPTEEVEA